MYTGNITLAPTSERVAFFKQDIRTRKLLQALRSKYGSTLEHVYGFDVDRELSDTFMTYYIVGLTMPEMMEAAREVDPMFTFERAERGLTTFDLVWCAKALNSPEFLDITDIEV